MSKYCVLASLILIWVGALLIPLGTAEKVASPRYFESYRHMIAEPDASGAELGPALVATMVLQIPFAVCFGVLIAATFTTGIIAVRELTAWNRRVGLLVAFVVWANFLAGSTLVAQESLDSFHWGFNILGYGELIWAAALALGTIGSVGQCLLGARKKGSCESLE
jgi:hypothetical protein